MESEEKKDILESTPQARPATVSKEEYDKLLAAYNSVVKDYNNLLLINLLLSHKTYQL